MLDSGSDSTWSSQHLQTDIIFPVGSFSRKQASPSPPSDISELSLKCWLDHVLLYTWGGKKVLATSRHRDWEWRGVILNRGAITRTKGGWILGKMEVISYMLETEMPSKVSLCWRKYSLFVGLPELCKLAVQRVKNSRQFRWEMW